MQTSNKNLNTEICLSSILYHVFLAEISSNMKWLYRSYGRLVISSASQLLPVCLPCTVEMLWGFHNGSAGQEPTCNAGDAGSIPESGISPGRRQWHPTPVLLPGKSHGWRSLVGYSPRGPKSQAQLSG